MIHEIEIKLSVERFNELNNRRFKKGDLVHFINRGASFTPYYYVDWGIVEDVYAGTYGLKLYELRDVRAIDGIPIKDYNFNSTKWRKLPKGWTYNTRLYSETEILTDEEREWRDEKVFEKGLPDTTWVFEGIENGWLVTPSSQDKRAHIEAEITSQGFRIVSKHPMYEPSSGNTIFHRACDYVSIPFHQVYASYSEANEFIVEDKARLDKIASMTDREFFEYQVCETLSKCNEYTDEQREKIKSILFADLRFEEIEVRVHMGFLQWKYEDNKNWKGMVI